MTGRDAREAFDARVWDHQWGLCDAQHASGRRAGPPGEDFTRGPCGECEPCRMIADALDWDAREKADVLSVEHDDQARRHEVIATLCGRVEEERIKRVRVERERDGWHAQALELAQEAA